MVKLNDRLRGVLQDARTFLEVVLAEEALSSTASASREALIQKLRQLQREAPHLFLALDFSEATRSGQQQVRPLSSPHPYLDMQPGILTKPADEDASPEYVYSDTLVQSEDGPAPRCFDERSVEESVVSEDDGLQVREDDRGDEGSTVAEVPACELSKAEKTGFLEKKGKDRLGGLLSTSQKRWCAIRGGVLYVYDKPTDKRQRDHVLLASYEARPFAYATKDAAKRDAAFELVCPGKRTYQFVAYNGKDMKQWISAIERNSRVFPPASKESDARERGSPASKPQTSKCEISPPVEKTAPRDSEESYECVEAAEDEEPLYEDGESYVGGRNAEEEKAEGNEEDWYVGLWDCTGSRPDELSFGRGDLLKVVGREYDADAWWLGATCRGEIGFVPKTYLMRAFEKVEE